MEQKKVMLTLVGVQSVDGEKDVIELKTRGNLFKKEKGIYVTYQESEATGYEGCQTTLKIEENKVTMLRFGKYKTTLIMEENNRSLCTYPTAAGPLVLGVSQVHIQNQLGPSGGEICVQYALDHNENHLSDHSLHIKIKEIGNEYEHDTTGKK